jgi:hypothetical protein
VARSYGKLALNKRIMVNLTTGTAIDGVLWDDRGPLIVLKDANVHTNGQSAALDSEVIIDRARIDFVQVLG